MREKSGITVEIVDLSSLQGKADEFVKKHSTFTKADLPKLGRVKRGPRLYVLINEGVGDLVTETVEVDFHGTSAEGRSFMPVGRINLSRSDFEALGVAESVQLEDFIRVFGHRLESNYGAWLRELNR